MPSDRTRKPDDLRQGYKRPIMQQGRVILDRDFNALHEMLGDTIEGDALDSIGQCGTPDNGFAISLPPPGSPPLAKPYDFLIAPGTMYVGGLRAVLPAPAAGQPALSYFNQPDWAEPLGPFAASGGSPPGFPQAEFIYLHLLEQEVSAIEDPDIKDVALGGPDTTQRLRLMRRVERMSIKAGDITCGPALTDAEANWSSRGLVFDPNTMRLVPQATLQVSFLQAQTNPNPCDPTSQGGYAGPDNQLIRVQLSDGGNGPGSPTTLLWGYDNASCLHRAAVSADGITVKLSPSPVDAFHSPQAGQIVEVLRTAALLGSEADESGPTGTTQIVRCVADATGFVCAIATAYNPSTRTVVLNQKIPAAWQNDPNPLFLRVWQGQLRMNPSGGTVALTENIAPGTTANPVTTGLQVTIAVPQNGVLPVGAYWMIAVRPGTPQAVYPECLLTSPQPPDGPRGWACPLAVIDWTGVTAVSPPTGEQPVVDCRNQFYNLVELTKLTGSTPLVAGVLGTGVYGQPFALQNGGTLAVSDLARGLTVLLNRSINPASAIRAACFVEVEAPLVAGGQTVAYQPVVLAAVVAAPVTTEISWNPKPGTQQYLANQLQNEPPAPFPENWDTFAFNQAAATWNYSGASVQASVASSNAFNASQEAVAINKQPLSAGASGVSMTISPAPNINQNGPTGLIFNYLNTNDFWGVVLSLFPNVTETEYAGVGVTATVAHYVNGLAQQLATDSSGFGNIISKINFSIAATAAGLSFGIQMIFSEGGQAPIQFSQLQVPGGLVAGSRVGLFTGVNGNTDFAQLAIEYFGGSQSQILVPPPQLPLLSRLTLKGGLLEFTDQTRTSLAPPEPDFSMWFWLQPQSPGGYSGYGAVGIGSDLI